MIEATGSLEMDIGQLRATNERDERTLESLFEQKHSRLKLKTDLETQLTVCSRNIRIIYTVLIFQNINSGISIFLRYTVDLFQFIGGEAVCGCFGSSNARCNAPKVRFAQI